MWTLGVVGHVPWLGQAVILRQEKKLTADRSSRLVLGGKYLSAVPSLLANLWGQAFDVSLCQRRFA